jgi:hypothetical protein
MKNATTITDEVKTVKQPTLTTQNGMKMRLIQVVSIQEMDMKIHQRGNMNQMNK